MNAVRLGPNFAHNFAREPRLGEADGLLHSVNATTADQLSASAALYQPHAPKQLPTTTRGSAS